MKTGLFPSLCGLWASTSSSYKAGKKGFEEAHQAPRCKKLVLFLGPRTIFLTSKISNVHSRNLIIITHKTQIGTAKGQRLVIAIHLDQSNHLANQQQVLCFAVRFTSLSTL
jgi:hypothetical protein